jgi:hypothetical protein
MIAAAAPRLKNAPQRNSTAGPIRSGGVVGVMAGCYLVIAGDDRPNRPEGRVA